MRDLIISIINTNNKELLRDCLDSIFLYPPNCDFKVVVFDNQSHDGSIEMVKREYPEVELVENVRTNSFASRHNYIIKNNMHAKYFLIFHEDSVTKENTLTKMFKFMEANTDIGVLGCKLLYPDGKLQASIGAYPSVSDVLIRLGQNFSCLSQLKWFSKYSPENWDYGKYRELIGCYPMGCCLMIRRQTIENVGLMDERFAPAYLEDTDWCYRIKKAGFKIYYLADAEAIHYHGYTIRKSSKDFKTAMSLAWFRNRRYYFKKHYSAISYYFLVIIDFLFFSISLLKWSILYLLKKENRKIAREHIKYSKKAWLEIFHRTKQQEVSSLT